jgi:hypothetical protein
VFSPDGSHVLVVDQANEESGFRVYDVESGSSHAFDLLWYDVGWTPSGDLLSVDGTRVSTCDPDSGECRDVAVDPPGKGELKLGGRGYES